MADARAAFESRIAIKLDVGSKLPVAVRLCVPASLGIKAKPSLARKPGIVADADAGSPHVTLLVDVIAKPSIRPTSASSLPRRADAASLPSLSVRAGTIEVAGLPRVDTPHAERRLAPVCPPACQARADPPTPPRNMGAWSSVNRLGWLMRACHISG
ncbi:MAG: hypothetical protein ACKVW3_00915 [Phycisphaerales bacterium]